MADSGDVADSDAVAVAAAHTRLNELVSQIECYLDGGKYEEATKEGLSVLKALGNGELSLDLKKFTSMICDLVFSKLDNGKLGTKEVPTLVLDTLAEEFAVDKEKADVFLEVAFYFAMRCQKETREFCDAVASHLMSLAKIFSKVNLPLHGLTMRLYAIKFSVPDLNYYSRDGNSNLPEAENTIFAHTLLVEMENQLSLHIPEYLETSTAVLSGTYMPYYFGALKFLCEPLSVLIQSNFKRLICGFKDISPTVKLYNIENVLQHFIRVFDAYRKYEKEKFSYKDKSQAVLAVATAAFALSFTTEKYVEVNKCFLKELVSAEWVQLSRFSYLCEPLKTVGLVLLDAQRLKEAEVASYLCCQAAWKCVMDFCEMFVSSKDETSTELSEDRISDLFTNACEHSTVLLEILYERGTSRDEISAILTLFLESWSAAQNLFDKLPFPVVLVKHWVNILCIQTKHPEDEHGVKTIYHLMSSSLTMSKKTLGLLLEQEIEAYREVQSLYPQLCKIMQMAIFKILLEDVYTTSDFDLQKSRILIAKGRELRARGVKGMNECIQSLSEAISILDAYNKDKDVRGPVCYVLAEAYCLRALCRQDSMVDPKDRAFLVDIDLALKLWLNQEHFPCVEKTDMVHHNTLNLLYHVSDLLSLKGCMDHHSDIYELMIRFCTCKDVPLKDFLAMLWQTKTLSHALCISHVHDKFILTFSKHCETSKSLKFWKSCMEKSEPLKVGFQQCLSVISTLCPSSSGDHDPATDPSRSTIDDVKKTAFNLISYKEPLSLKELYVFSNLYYDLSERLMSEGSMIEARSYALEAFKLRGELYRTSFFHSFDKKDGSLESFHMQPLVAIEAWSSDKDSSNFDFILTPWNILRCYLESILQVGIIHEIVGDAYTAATTLLWGKQISAFKALPIFFISFSVVLGKLLCKQGSWDSAAEQLDSVDGILADRSFLLSCSKCKLILEVKVNLQRYIIIRSRPRKLDSLLKAENCYHSAVKTLNQSEWKNCISNPKGTTSGNKVFCDTVPYGENNDVVISSDCGDSEEQEAATRKDGNGQDELKGTQSSMVDCMDSCGCEDTCAFDELSCWHCVLLEVINSSSLTNVIHMQWELTRRRLLVELLIERGNFLWACSETQRAHEVCLESIFVLANRSTFHSLKSKISFNQLIKLIERNAIGEMLTVEHAAILYTVCWFSIRSRYDDTRRNHPCGMLDIPIPTIVFGLKVSLTRCREIPDLFQKVSRLLGVLYTLSSVNTFPELVSSNSLLSVTQWACYFHQASLGTYLNCELFSRLGKQKNINTTDADSSLPSSSRTIGLHRLVCKSSMELEGFVLNFFQSLPQATIICICILGDDYASWLRNLFPHEPIAQSWIMFSRLSLDSAPIMIVLPVTSILPGVGRKSSDSEWYCPWGRTVVDEIAPYFRTILEEYYLASRSVDRKERARKRKQLDHNLEVLVGHMEATFFGLWKDILMGVLSNHKEIEGVQKRLREELKSKCHLEVHENIIKAVTSGGGQRKSLVCLLKLMTNDGCYIGGRECIEDINTGFNLLSKAMFKI